MIEIDVRNYLSDVLDVDVFTETPDNPPLSFVRFEVTGGEIDNGVRSATLAIQSYAQTMQGASMLNELVIQAMENIADNVANVYESNLNSFYNFTDTTTKKYRYQCVYNLFYY